MLETVSLLVDHIVFVHFYLFVTGKVIVTMFPLFKGYVEEAGKTYLTRFNLSFVYERNKIEFGKGNVQ